MMVPKIRLSRVWIGALLLCTCGVALLVGLPRRTPPGQAPPETEHVPERPPVDPAALAAVCEILAPPADAKAPEREKMVAGIARIGSAALPVAVALLCGDEPQPVVASGTFDQPIHPRAVELRDTVLREAIRGFDAQRRLACLSERGAGAPLDVLRVIIGLLAEVDHSGALRELLRLAEGIEPIHWQRAYIAEPVEDAFAAQLERRPESVRELRGRLRGADPAFAGLLVRAAARVRANLTLEFVVDMLGRHDDLDAEVLKALTRIGHGGRVALSDEALERVRRAIGSSDPKLRRLALDAAGALRDGFAVDAMIDQLSDEQPVVAQAARRALTAIAGLDRGAQPQAWIAWRDEELAWRDESGEAALEQLSSDDPGVVFAAIAELVSRPLARWEAADAIAPLASSPDAAIAEAACSALCLLGSGRAIPGLLAVLTTEDEVSRERARNTLEQLTGLALPADLDAWRGALER